MHIFKNTAPPPQDIDMDVQVSSLDIWHQEKMKEKLRSQQENKEKGFFIFILFRQYAQKFTNFKNLVKYY